MQMWSLLDESRYLFTLCHKGQFVMNIKMFKEAFFFFFFAEMVLYSLQILQQMAWVGWKNTRRVNTDSHMCKITSCSLHSAVILYTSVILTHEINKAPQEVASKRCYYNWYGRSIMTIQTVDLWQHLFR